MRHLFMNVQTDERLLVQMMMTQHTDGTVKIRQDVINVRMDIQTKVNECVRYRVVQERIYQRIV